MSLGWFGNTSEVLEEEVWGFLLGLLPTQPRPRYESENARMAGFMVYYCIRINFYNA